MSISSFSIDPAWRDYWGQWSPMVEPLIAPLEKSKCHAPRIAVVPSLDSMVIPTSGTIRYNFHLVPGSLIWGAIATLPSNGDQTTPARSQAMQLTDNNIGHELFQEPMSAWNAMSVTGEQIGAMPGPVFLFPSPWPVVGDGLFTYQAWGTPGDEMVMLLMVAEVTDCPVR